MDDHRKVLAKEWFDAATSDFHCAELEELRDACELLMGFYIESRYPPDMPQYSKEEIIEAFSNAQRVKEKIEEAVQNFLHG